MPPTRIKLNPDAAADAEEAASWYAERSALAAKGFLAELDLVLGRVLEAPGRWPRFEMGTRRYVFPRFPFSLNLQNQRQRHRSHCSSPPQTPPGLLEA